MGSRVSSVVFDFGGVIITPITNQISDLASDLGCSVEALREVLMGPSHESGSHPWHRLERGEIDQHDLQDALAPYAAALAVPWRGDEVERVLAPGQFTIHDEMIECIRSLRDRGYRTGLLSNSIREFRPTLEQYAPPSLFDVYVDSSEVGRRKPEPEIFSALLDRLDETDPSQVVFLDDFVANVNGARSVGLRAIHVSDPNSALSELEILLARSSDAT